MEIKKNAISKQIFTPKILQGRDRRGQNSWLHVPEHYLMSLKQTRKSTYEL